MYIVQSVSAECIFSSAPSSSSFPSSCPSCTLSFPLPHLQLLCYQGSQAKGWSNHNFSVGLGRNNEVTKLQLPWQRHIQEHRMPLLKKKIDETGPGFFFSPCSLLFSYPSLSLFPSSPSPCLHFFFHSFSGSTERRGAVHFHSLGFPQPFVSQHIQNNKFIVATFASFWYSCLVGGLFPLTFTWRCPFYKAH